MVQGLNDAQVKMPVCQQWGNSLEDSLLGRKAGGIVFCPAGRIRRGGILCSRKGVLKKGCFLSVQQLLNAGNINHVNADAACHNNILQRKSGKTNCFCEGFVKPLFF